MTYKQEISYVKPEFWSTTTYDSDNNYTIDNPINRYILGSDTPLIKSWFYELNLKTDSVVEL